MKVIKVNVSSTMAEDKFEPGKPCGPCWWTRHVRRAMQNPN